MRGNRIRNLMTKLNEGPRNFRRLLSKSRSGSSGFKSSSKTALRTRLNRPRMCVSVKCLPTKTRRSSSITQTVQEPTYLTSTKQKYCRSRHLCLSSKRSERIQLVELRLHAKVKKASMTQLMRTLRPTHGVWNLNVQYKQQRHKKLIIR